MPPGAGRWGTSTPPPPPPPSDRTLPGPRPQPSDRGLPEEEAAHWAVLESKSRHPTDDPVLPGGRDEIAPVRASEGQGCAAPSPPRSSDLRRPLGLSLPYEGAPGNWRQARSRPCVEPAAAWQRAPEPGPGPSQLGPGGTFAWDGAGGSRKWEGSLSPAGLGRPWERGEAGWHAAPISGPREPQSRPGGGRSLQRRDGMGFEKLLDLEQAA